MPEPVPQKRTRQFSFTNFSLTQPNRQHPGDRLDGEVDATNAVLNDVIDFVRQAISDEGTIRFEAIEDGTYIIATGPVGPPGPPFQPNATGNTADRTTYNAEAPGFAFLDTQASPPLLYFRQTATPGVWSAPITFNNGPTGPSGPAGPPGAAGANGATVHIVTSGTPSNALGNNGDLAVNPTNGNVWSKVAGSYVLQGNIRGPQGLPGATGATGPTGPVGPAGPAGSSLTLATESQALDGTDNAAYMSALRTRQAINARMTAEFDTRLPASMFNTTALVAGTTIVVPLTPQQATGSATNTGAGSLNPNLGAGLLPAFTVLKGGTIRIIGTLASSGLITTRTLNILRNGTVVATFTTASAFAIDVTVAAGDTITMNANGTGSTSSGGGTGTVTVSGLQAGFASNPGLWSY